MNTGNAKALVERFAEKQVGGHFACPRCGRMAMAANPTHNALSRRATVYVCDACGMQEALEDAADSRTPLTAWAICKTPAAWRMPLLLTFVGRDSWDRPVYESAGRLYVDVDPRKYRTPDICTKLNNEFDGEPDTPIAEGTEVEFVPARDTW